MKFVDTQFVAFTGFFETQKSVTYRRDNHCLAHARTQLLIGHDTHYTLCDPATESALLAKRRRAPYRVYCTPERNEPPAGENVFVGSRTKNSPCKLKCGGLAARSSSDLRNKFI